MPMRKEFEETYEQILHKEDVLPEEWSALYDVEMCLKDTPYKKTFLIKEKNGETEYILKLARGDASEHLVSEEKMMNELHNSHLFLHKEDAAYLIRDYVEGTSLAEIRDKWGFPRKEVLQIGIMLCEEVAKLHQRKPPVIHRDIKPENIIWKSDGRLALIDLETARTYKKGKHEDTRFVGTRETAAPEQYGYGQSDERTDIYGIGKTLLYLLTGDYNLAQLEKESEDRRLNSIIEKCCALEPNSRFATVKHVSNELEKCMSFVLGRNGMVRILTVFTLGLLVLVIILFHKVVTLEKRIEEQPFEQAETVEEKKIGRIIISGWDVTDYDILLEQILDSCEQRDYEQVTAKCKTLLNDLYADEYLQTVETEDTYYYAPEDERWKDYNVTRMGYELTADRLAYHDNLLEREADHLEQYQYYIVASIRGNEAATEVDQEGNVQYTLLHQYSEENSAGKADIDYSISCLLDAIVEGIERYYIEEK